MLLTHVLHLLESILCSFHFPTISVSHPSVNRLPRSVWSMWPAMMTYPAVVMMLRLLWGYYPSVGALMLWILHHTYRFRRWKWARRRRPGVQSQLGCFCAPETHAVHSEYKLYSRSLCKEKDFYFFFIPSPV